MSNHLVRELNLICPDCGAQLEAKEPYLSCFGCGRNWPVRGDIPVFDDENVYWGEIPELLMRKIVDEARSRDWRTAVKHHLGEAYPKLIDYVTNEMRADWRLLLPLDKTKKVLDLGAGWGLTTQVLSKICGRVVAYEKIPLRVEFLRLRREQEPLDNVQIIQGDILKLPFAANEFDVVVCNGVLEWVGLYDGVRSPSEAQVAFLRKLARCLKPTGHLYIGIENRFGYKQWLGSRDHSGLRFTSLLPRFLADWATRIFQHNKSFFLDEHKVRGYRTYTYSASGYRKLLEGSGFRPPEIYYALPSYNYPRWLIPADCPEAFRYLFKYLFFPRTSLGRTLKKVANLKLPGTPQRFFLSDFCMVTQKVPLNGRTSEVPSERRLERNAL